MRIEIEDVLTLQDEWTSLNTAAMSLRGSVIRTDLPNAIRKALETVVPTLPNGVQDIQVQGRDGTGLKNEVPWVRVFSGSRSKSATEGWYLVYLFDAFGDRAYLSINQGTTRWDGGEFRARSRDDLVARASWARTVLAESLDRTDLRPSIQLPTRASKLGAGYVFGNVVALEYESTLLPLDQTLTSDLRYMVRLLSQLYLAEDAASYVPGDVAPEVLDAVESATIAAGQTSRKRRPRLTGPERRAIELRAVVVAMGYLQGLGYKTKDVGATESYDIDARRGEERLYVEVKGTVSPGQEIILTRNEVALHLEMAPDTMLIVVAGILLTKGEEPTAEGGELLAISPWLLDEEQLVPLSYAYSGAELLRAQQAPQMPRPAS